MAARKVLDWILRKTFLTAKVVRHWTRLGQAAVESLYWIKSISVGDSLAILEAVSVQGVDGVVS